MDTRPDERLAYPDLAKQSAQVKRLLEPDQLPRLCQLAPPQGPVDVEMRFYLAADGRPRVQGHARTLVAAECQRCLETLERPLRVDFDVCIVTDPELASELAEGVDVLLAEGGSVSVAEVVEDELILSLPERLCESEPCPLAPSLAYPAGGEAADGAADKPAHKDNPFDVLAELKR